MKLPKKAFTTTIAAFLMLSVVLAAMSFVTPMASAAAAAITLTPSQAVAGSSVTVTGTGFAANSAVGIGFGAEIGATAGVTPTNNAGSFRVTLPLAPIKPGTLYCVRSIYQGTIFIDSNIDTDDGLGNITNTQYTTGAQSYFGTLNYATGLVAAEGVATYPGFTIIYSLNYVCYQYAVAPVAGITTSASGSFTANITVPRVSVGAYNVTAIDAGGKLATNSLNVSDQPIPEALSFGTIVLLSSIIVLVSSLYLTKRPNIRNSNHTTP